MAHFSKVYSAQTVGLSAHIISVETDITKNTLQAFSVVGLPDKAVEESRDRVSAAIKNTKFTSPKNINYKTIMSLAPADLKKEGPLFDVAMAIGYLAADNKIFFDTKDKIFLGELSLNGDLRPIKGVLVLVKEAKKRGFKEVYLPKENAREGALIGDIDIFGIDSLSELIGHLDAKSEKINKNIISKKITSEKRTVISYKNSDSKIDFSDIRGQDSAKRGLEIAAAGGHNIAMYGPPGTGKTMLAKAFVNILPKMSFEDMLEVTEIASVVGILKDTLMTNTPFRAPHHTSSYTAIVGGGTVPKPGEITLAHKGVLFLDEFPEFDRRVIESLRQPLEDRVIHISRAKGAEIFPANFILVAAMNPCPCGKSGTEGKRCVCTTSSLIKYRKKLSGPIIDRIDIWVQVNNIAYEKILQKDKAAKTSAEFKTQIELARERQRVRFSQNKHTIKTNSEMDVKDIDSFINLTSEIKNLLNESAKNLGMSPRAYHKIIKVARTIADLEKSEEISKNHILEALQYRPKTD